MAQMTAIRNPRVTLNLIQRDQIVSIEDQRILVVGQMLSGTAAAGLVPDIPRTTPKSMHCSVPARTSP